ncbi:hypothetical protein [Streptomyces sp. NEAU-174]|uniref:hypothetical protein n=1 Tax=Streptomyces sp. NEAU-174 TaxID=3458254 RepID=UPI0040450547
MKSRVVLAFSAAAVALTTVLAAPAALAATADPAGKGRAAVPTAQAALPEYRCQGIDDRQAPSQVIGVGCTPNNWPEGHFVMQGRERTYVCYSGYYAYDGNLVGNNCIRLY